MIARILVIEDERDLGVALRINLEAEGYEVELAGTGAEGLAAAGLRPPSLLVLDVMLPDMTGYEVLDRLRRAGASFPVLLLTARAEEVDKVRGFRAGADDYVTKPFGLMELLLRIAALLRRCPAPPVGAAARSGQPETELRLGNVAIDIEGRVVRRENIIVELSPRAYQLLLALGRRRGCTVTRQELLREVWAYDSSVTTRTVDSHVAELRRKLDSGNRSIIKTVWRVGYRLEE